MLNNEKVIWLGQILWAVIHKDAVKSWYLGGGGENPSFSQEMMQTTWAWATGYSEKASRLLKTQQGKNLMCYSRPENV